MVNKRLQRKKLRRLPHPDPTQNRDETFEPQCNPQLRKTSPGNWLKNLSGIRCQECESTNRKKAKFCDQCGIALKDLIF